MIPSQSKKPPDGAAEAAPAAATRPPLSAASMRRVDPLTAKSSAEIRNRGRNELDPATAPHRYLKDLCLEPVMPTPRCVKPHYHAAADKCEDYGKINEDEYVNGGAENASLLCQRDHYHGWFAEVQMRRILKSERKPTLSGKEEPVQQDETQKENRIESPIDSKWLECRMGGWSVE